MEKLKTLHDVSSFYFFVMAFLYIAMTLSIRNEFLPDVNLALMRILDVPFALVALLYGGTALGLQLKFDAQGKLENKTWGIVILTLGILLFGVVAVINFALPNTA